MVSTQTREYYTEEVARIKTVGAKKGFLTRARKECVAHLEDINEALKMARPMLHGERKHGGHAMEMEDEIGLIDRLRAELQTNTKTRIMKNLNLTTETMEINVQDMYQRTFPQDSLGNDIVDDLTVQDVLEALETKQDIYETIGVFDSLVREGVFEILSTITGKSYDTFYSQWLQA